MIAAALFLLGGLVPAPAAPGASPLEAQSAPPASTHAGVVVLKAIGPSARQWPTGQILPSDSLFVLRPGDTVVIVRNNWIRVFRGPGHFKADEPLQPRPPVNLRGCSSCALLPAPRSGGMWEHNMDSWGSVCVRPGRGPTLWRESHDRAEQFSITPTAGGPRKVIELRPGQRTLDWPADLPLVDGAKYLMDLPGGRGPQATVIRVLPQLDSDDTRAFGIALHDRQCSAQIWVLAKERLDPRDREPAAVR
jgi:hypothetical protein